MQINVLFFGILSEVCGSSTLQIKDIENIRQLKSHLWKTYPEMKEMDFRIAINKEIVDGKIDFKDGDEIALMPPFAGG